MSDTKTAGEILTFVCNARRNSDIRADDKHLLKLLDDQFAAQLQRIAELERALSQETLVSDRLRLSWREDVATERLRAEAAEAQVKALLEALPVISALRMAKEQLVPGARDALRAYAVAAKPKER